MDPLLNEVSQIFERFKAALIRSDFNTCTNLLSQLKVPSFSLDLLILFFDFVKLFVTRLINSVGLVVKSEIGIKNLPSCLRKKVFLSIRVSYALCVSQILKFGIRFWISCGRLGRFGILGFRAMVF